MGAVVVLYSLGGDNFEKFGAGGGYHKAVFARRGDL